jgi:hypothetical protein
MTDTTKFADFAGTEDYFHRRRSAEEVSRADAAFEESKQARLQKLNEYINERIPQPSETNASTEKLA